MANNNNTTTVNINVTDNGTTNRVTGNVKTLRDLLTSTANTAQTVGTRVSGAFSSAASAAKKRADIEEGVSYGVGRSAVGTGAASRDFAKQAQGLGGLVRVYATFAANIFAVATAFEALKKSAATERLEKSTEMLSVRMGVNLKSIAKDLQSVTGYALSTAEALQFTNIGASAGLAGDQIKNLVVIAKGAANVLNRDVGDSITRIIQGTAKQEQEILDELGIFVKSRDAFAEYAKKYEIKGGADALSAQQKVLAYADAVAKYGEKYKEFAGIEDPFSKFISKGKESLNEILKFINMGVIPLLKLLNESGSAIQGIILLIGGTLLKRALPELKKDIENIFTFDKQKSQAKAAEERLAITTEYTKTTQALQALKVQRDSLLNVPAVTGAGITNTVASGSALSAQRLTTKVIGTDKSPVNITKYKEIADMEATVLRVIKDQVNARSKNIEAQEKLITQLKDQNLITKASTVEALVLGKEGERVAAASFAAVDAKNKALVQQLAIEKQIAIVSKEQAALEARVNKLGLGSYGVNTPSAVSQAFTGQLLKTNQIAQDLDAQLGQSYTKSIKAYGVAMAAAAKEVGMAATAQVSFAAASRLAGAAVGVASIALKGLIGAVSSLFLPLTAVWIAWEIFGDKIKEWTGFSNSSTKQLEAQQTAMKEWENTINLSVSSLERFNKEQAQATKEGDTDKLVDIANRRLANINEQVNATEKLIKTLDEAEAVKAKSDAADEARKNGNVFSEPAYYAKQLLENTKLTAAEQQKVKAAIIDIETIEKRRLLGTLSQKSASEETRKALNDILEIQKAINKEDQQRAASMAAYKADVDGVVKYLEEIRKKQKGSKENLGFKTEAAEDGYNKAIKALSADAVVPIEARTKDMVTILNRLGEATKENSPRILEFAAALNAAGSSTEDLENAMKKLAESESFRKILQSAFKEVETLASSAKSRVKPYTDSLKAYFKETEVAIDSAVAKIRVFDREASDISVIANRTKTVIGAMTEEQNARLKTIAILKSEEEWKKSVAQADLEYRKTIEKRNSDGTMAAPKGSEEAEAAKRSLALAIDNANAIREASIYTANQNSILNEIDIALNNINRQYDSQLRTLEALNALNDAGLSIRQSDLTTLTELNQLYQSTAINRSEALEKERIQITQTRETELALMEKAREIQKLNAQPGLDESTRAQREQEINNIYNTRKAIIDSNANSQLKILDNTTKVKTAQNNLNIALQFQEEKLQRISDVGISLTKVFEGFNGTLENIGSAFETIAMIAEKTANAQLKAEKDKQDELTKIRNGDGSEIDKLAAIDEVSKKYAKDEKKRELDKTAAILGATKTLFKEKTVAYKAFAAFEKIIHIARLAMDVKEMISDTTKTASDVANSATRTGASVAEASVNAVAGVIKAISTMVFPLNLIAGAATAAVMAALISQIGGKSPKAPVAGYSSEQRQEVQGTGRMYNSRGEIVETGGGVFGDSSAKSDSIAKSIEIIKKTSVEGITFFSKMLSALESIDQGINNTVKGLYTIPGIRSGSMFGTTNSSSDTGKWASFNPDIIKGLTSLFSGKKITTEIEDAGVRIKGSFADIMNGIVGTIQAYETVKTTTSRSGLGALFGKNTSVNITTQYQNLNNEVTQQISSIFKYAGDLFVELGDKLGITNDAISVVLSNLNIDQLTSLRDLTGEDFEKEFNAVISTILDDASKALFASMIKYQEFGEGILETVVRVVDGNIKVNDALKSMGKATIDAAVIIKDSASGFTRSATELKEYSISVSQALINAAGGLEEFIDKTKFFSDNFLSEAERLAPKQKALTEELNRLGLSSIDTREEFKQLVLSLDLTNEVQRNLYVSLLNIADAFNEVYAATEQALSAEDYRVKLLSLEVEKQKLLGNVSSSVAISRMLEIEELKKLPAEQSKNLIATKLSIFALQDAVSVRNAEIAVIKAAGNTYEALIYEREMELYGLTEELRVIKLRQYMAEDAAKTDELRIALLEAEGKVSEATAIRRAKELKSMSATDAALKIRIWRLQDEAAIISARSTQEEKIYTLLGKSVEALAIARQRELDALDPQLQIAQKYIYALEDEATLKEKLISQRDKEKQALEATSSSLKQYLNVLRDYKVSLLGGDNSTLTPSQKYDLAKAEVLRLAGVANSVAITDAEKEARQAALDKLPSATDTWLEASRNLYASSTAYTSDFQQVLGILDMTSEMLESTKSDSEKQLDELIKSTNFLDSISENTKSTSELLSEYLTAQQVTAEAQAAAAVSGSVAAGGTQTAIEVAELIYQGLTTTLTPITTVLGNISNDIAGAIASTLLPGSLADSNLAVAIEIEKLRNELSSLRNEQREQTGDLITSNYDSSNRAAETVTEALKEADNRKRWGERLTENMII